MSRVRRNICSAIVGIVFGLSAIFKLVDPVGTGLIVSSYFKFLHLDFLCGASEVSGILLSLVEGVTGIALMTKTGRSVAGPVAACLTVFFTVISILLVVFNPDMDCGCFGEVIHLTHLQTLMKNVVLLVLCAVAIIPFKELQLYDSRSYVTFFLGVALLVCLTVVSLIQTPVVEYTQFKTSHTIVPEGSVLQGPDNPALRLWDRDGEDRSTDILEGKVALISIYDIDGLPDRTAGRISRFAQDAWNAGFTPYVIAAGESDFPGVDSFIADYKSIITLNRSNGGVTMLDDGFIFYKTSRYGYPSFDELVSMAGDDSSEAYVKKETVRSLVFQIFLAGFFITSLFF